MNLFVLGLLLFASLAPQKQDLPDAFYDLPEEVRQQATLIVTGTYYEGRTPCFFISKTIRAWAMQSSIQIKKVYRGEAGGKFIYLNWSDLQHRGMKLKRDHTYLVLLRPDERSSQSLQKGEHVSFWDALEDEEIIGIVELK